MKDGEHFQVKLLAAPGIGLVTKYSGKFEYSSDTLISVDSFQRPDEEIGREAQ